MGSVSGEASPVLTHAEQIRRLSAEQAGLGYPVRVRGVITMDAPAPDFFIQDATAGIYVEGSVSPKYAHALGQLVEIEGITGPGKFAPVIREQRLRVLGKGVLPKAQLFPFSELADGREDSQWARVRGIVRSVGIDRNSWRETTLAMRVASDGGEFNVRVPIGRDQEEVPSWVDSEVLIEGVCGSLFNANRQLTGILFYVPRLSFMTVGAPAREALLSDLLRFSPGKGGRHRVRVRGVVGYQQLGNALFLVSQGKGLRVLTQQSTPLEIGDLVDVLGFPAMGDSGPMLEDAVYQLLSREKAPEPVKLNLATPWEQFDGAVVTTEAKLLNRQAQPDGLRLLLQHGDVFLDAALPPGVVEEHLLSIPLNSEVRITGICLVRSGGLWRIPQSIRVLLRSPQGTWWCLALPRGGICVTHFGVFGDDRSWPFFRGGVGCRAGPAAAGANGRRSPEVEKQRSARRAQPDCPGASRYAGSRNWLASPCSWIWRSIASSKRHAWLSRHWKRRVT